ncbi:MAG: tetratricopeptide (TPR) repeat protein [Salibacteraceae bacterium]|jgi:tetratricopeptide (TPR) repeat protein
MDFKKLNNLGGILVFVIAFFTYGTTIEPTTSFWDCGEYIATANKLEVGHPPGAPTFLLIARVASMFVAPENVAYMVNMMSALTSALTILFLFWTITYLAKKIVKDEEMTTGSMIAILGSSLLGSLAFTFSDTFWFSAVEGEVYAMSSFMTALVFWAILKWESIADEPHSNRWIIFIWFIVGISIGVHLLNLLAIPAIIFVYYFKKYEPTAKGLAAALTLSVIILGFVQMVLIPQIINIAAKFELLFTNGFGMPFNTGATIFGLLILGGVTYALYYTQKNNKVLANTLTLSFTVLLLGYMTFGVIIIRSNANPPIDENNPENMVNLLSYLNREQYGSSPLAYGHFFDSPLNNKAGGREMYKDGNPVYFPNEITGEYEIADDRKGSIPNYASEFNTIFPRMWSSKANHKAAYKTWSNFTGKPIKYNNLQSGKSEVIKKPTFGENISYFVNYQLWWMWGRYFAWNFIGRQNDLQGHGIDAGDLTNGNVMSGITAIDEMYLGNLDNYPDDLSKNKAMNFYYFLPFIIGLIGLYFQSKFDQNNALVVFLLFMFTGIAIAVFLNMYPYQPRERDYAFVGSFYAFAIWIGLAVIGMYRALRDKVSGPMLASGLTVVTLLAAPVLMATQNWDDHDRSDRYTAREIARNYLESCDQNAILFTNGDNDTFPLWYLQEVEGVRTDVRVVNLMLLNTDWYIDQMSRKAYDGEPIPISMNKDEYRQGTRDFMHIYPDSRLDQDASYNVRDIVKYITDDKNKVKLGNGQNVNVIPVRNFKVKVDKEKILSSGLVAAKDADQIVDNIEWKLTGNYVMKNHLIVLDMLAHFNWDRPIYFSITMGKDSFYGLEEYFQQEGFAYRLVPVKTKSSGYRDFGTVNTEKMYDRLMNQFVWGGYENENLWMDENNQRFITNIRFTFVRLAEALIEEDKKDKAEEVLDRVTEVAIHDNFSYNGSVLAVVENYYKIGANDKANALLRKMVENESQYLEYYNDQTREDFKRFGQKSRQSLGIIGQAAMMVTQNFPQTQEVQDEFSILYQEYATLFQGRI